MFHPLDSVVTSVDVYDYVVVNPRNDNVVTIEGVDGVLPQNNTAWKTAKAFVDGAGTHGADIVVTKGIPFGAGMGGSSADASAVAYAMQRIYGIPDDFVYQVCNAVGSDVWYMLQGGYARMTGKGQYVRGFNAKSKLYYALTVFDEQCSARDVFAAFDTLPEQCHADNDKVVDLLCRGETRLAIEMFVNNLQPAAEKLTHYADKFVSVCGKSGLTPTMTGSGSAYFVAFDSFDQAKQACDKLIRYGFSSRVCADVPCGVEVVEE